MKIGVLGNIAFEVSDKYANAFDELKREHGWTYAKHDIAKNKPRLQGVGPELKIITFRGKFVDYFCNPTKELKRLTMAGDAMSVMTFVMGEQILGDYVLKKVIETWKATTNDGRVRWIEFEVNLEEYN